MARLLPCFSEWLSEQRDETKARALLGALAGESLKAANLADPEQREFDARELAEACHWPETGDFEAANKKVKTARMEAYLSSRAADLESFFTARSLDHAIRVGKRSPSGHHRAQWFLEVYPIVPSAESNSGLGQQNRASGSRPPGDTIEYEYSAAGAVKGSWLAYPLLANGSFRIKSLHGLAFACAFATPILCVAALTAMGWLRLFENRPLSTLDLAFVMFVVGMGWVLRDLIQAVWWLLSDRIIPASEMLVSWREAPAQLESFKAGATRVIGLVRYSATCPVCAAAIELRHGEGHQRRRLFGRCIEAPQEHVYSFDRVTRSGRRVL